MTTFAKISVPSRRNVPVRIRKPGLIVRAQALGLPAPLPRSKRSGRRTVSPTPTPKKASK